MENAQFNSCMIERLMGIDSCSTQQPVENYRVFSDKYLQKMSSVEMRRKLRFNKNRFSWMETDGPVSDDLLDMSTCSSMEQSFSISHPQRIDFSESSNSFGSEGHEKGCKPECECSCVPYLSESSGYSSSTSNGKICLSPAESDTVKQNVMKGQLDSFRLIRSLQDYLSGNTRKPRTDDNERKSSDMISPHSFKFRRRIYMDPEKELAAYTRYVKEKMNLSNSEHEDFTATPISFQSRTDHQRMQYNTPSFSFSDPCLRAMQVLKYSRRTSKVSKQRTCIKSSRESRHISCPDPKLARKNSTALKSLKDNCQDLVLHRSFSTKMVDQKTRSDTALSVSTSVHPNGLTDNVDQISSDVIDDGEKHQDPVQALPGLVFDTLFSPEPVSPRNSEEACQHSPVSVLQSSSNAEAVHFKHVNSELQELRMQLHQFETEFPKGISESSGTTFSNNEDYKEEVSALSFNLKHEARVKKNSPQKELVRDSRWLDLGEEIHATGTELESLLIDELIEDFICTQVLIIGT